MCICIICNVANLIIMKIELAHMKIELIKMQYRNDHCEIELIFIKSKGISYTSPY